MVPKTLWSSDVGYHLWWHLSREKGVDLITASIGNITIIIIIKKGWQCKAEREWYRPYLSEDPSPKIPTYRQKEEKGKKRRRL